MSAHRPCARIRIGFTLIELIIVMFILATLAGLLIPRLGFLQQQAMPLSGAAGSQDLMNNLETYKVSTGFYPQGFDSLLASGGTALIGQLIAGPSGTPPIIPFQVGSITADGFLTGSFGMGFGPPTVTSSSGTASGAYRVYDQDANYASLGEDVSSSFNTLRSIYTSGAVATVNPGTSSGLAIWQAVFPGGAAVTAGSGATATSSYNAPAATGVTLVAFGVGPQCNAIGTTMSSAPIQTGQVAGNYARYFAIFALYGANSLYPGKPAELKLVLDSNYNTANANVVLYKQATPVAQ